MTWWQWRALLLSWIDDALNPGHGSVGSAVLRGRSTIYSHDQLIRDLWWSKYFYDTVLTSSSSSAGPRCSFSNWASASEFSRGLGKYLHIFWSLPAVFDKKRNIKEVHVWHWGFLDLAGVEIRHWPSFPALAGAAHGRQGRGGQSWRIIAESEECTPETEAPHPHEG